MTLVVASLVERGISGVSRSSRKAFASGADAVEVRLDHIIGLSVRPTLIDDAKEAVNGVTIATYRSVGEGGRGRLTGRRREDLLRRVVDAGFEYVDLELTQDRALLDELAARRGSPKTISSSHFTDPVGPARLRSRLEKACACADIGKVAAPCENAGQAIRAAGVGLEFKRRRKSFTLM
ncbi:MAG: type I 3-dehydroquinate dehydratase [Methanobacteriota archaeon]|nr:MAG: type I 3-dehydroquinate dehydratase [Euryarchaeota archaeon]